MSFPLSKTPTADFGAQPVSRIAGPDWAVYANGVRLIALHALSDESLANDIAQEAIARAMSRMAAGGDAIADLGAFVRGIARHLIADAHRARNRSVSLDEAGELAEIKPDALSILASEDERRRVRDVLLQLSQSDRDILHLSFFEGLQPEEIAERMRESSVNVRKRKSRALERLRRAFIAAGMSR